MSVILDRLTKVGGRVSSAELRYQLAKRDNLMLSENELEVHLRHEELAGRVKSFLYFSAEPAHLNGNGSRPRRKAKA